MIHGLMGSSQGKKVRYLSRIFPGMLAPDFRGTLDERMRLLEKILERSYGWRIVGSSLGGLMGAMYACRNPQRVNKLVLMAPALIWPEFKDNLPEPVEMPVVIYHGSRDELIPLDAVREIAKKIFTNLEFHEVDDDHGLYTTMQEIDWTEILGD